MGVLNGPRGAVAGRLAVVMREIINSRQGLCGLPHFLIRFRMNISLCANPSDITSYSLESSQSLKINKSLSTSSNRASDFANKDGIQVSSRDARNLDRTIVLNGILLFWDALQHYIFIFSGFLIEEFVGNIFFVMYGGRWLMVVQIVLWYLDSGSSKHMTGNRSQLMNFVSKFLGTVRFGNDQIEKIMFYGDYQLGNVTITRVYYVEGLKHNLFLVGQFCDSDIEVAFRKNTCFIQNLDGVDLLSGSRDTNLYTISLDDMLKTSSICLHSKVSKTKSWLWHRRLSYLKFGTLNKLAKDDLVRGILKLLIMKKDHLCLACALGKSKKSSHQTKAEDTNQEKLYLLHIDLCGLVKFLRSKDEAPDAIIKCIKNIQVCLNATVRNVRIDNGTEFVNQTLREFYENVGISHQTSVARTPQQNDVVKR
ncbi:retrovirus-related pol polyprotein from transposon TNT 1-94 [Tanacetum coccineum]